LSNVRGLVQEPTLEGITFLVFPSIILQPFSQTLGLAEKACEERTL